MFIRYWRMYRQLYRIIDNFTITIRKILNGKKSNQIKLKLKNGLGKSKHK